MIASVEVGVSLGRPPRHDATVYVRVDAPTETAVELLACQIASCWPGVVMPVWSRIVAVDSL
jgi:hypothetical protein